MSLLLAKHVAAGGLARHAALVRAGNVNLPTAPFGAVAPAQLPEFDQPGLPAGAPPVHVKSVRARAGAGSVRAAVAAAMAANERASMTTSRSQCRRDPLSPGGRRTTAAHESFVRFRPPAAV